MATIQLVTRGDDAGSSRSANRAIRQACEEGMLFNISVMVPGPAFDDAAETLKDLKNVDFGLHVCLTSEWDTPRWGPVAPREQVPSLLDAEGWFEHMPRILYDRGFRVEEALLEVEAQLTRLRGAGFEVSYIDEHMGVGWISADLRAGIGDIAKREGLLDGLQVKRELPIARFPEAELATLLPLASEGAGPYLWVTHPMLDDEETRSFHGAGMTGEEVARERDHDRRLLLDVGLKKSLEEHGVVLQRYRDVLL